MSINISKGFAFISKTPPNYDTEHLWIVISDPREGKVMVVNLTTTEPYSENNVQIMPGEHTYVKIPSFVHYRKAKEVYVDAMISSFNSPHQALILHQRATIGLVNKIIQGAKSSDALPPKFLKYLDP